MFAFDPGGENPPGNNWRCAHEECAHEEGAQAGGIMTGTARGPKSDAEFFAERGFGQRIGFGERPALIVIDMLKAFTDETAPLGANLEPQLAAIVPLLVAAHARSAPVIFSSVRYDESERQGCRHLGAQDEGRDQPAGRRQGLGARSAPRLPPRRHGQ